MKNSKKKLSELRETTTDNQLGQENSINTSPEQPSFSIQKTIKLYESFRSERKMVRVSQALHGSFFYFSREQQKHNMLHYDNKGVFTWKGEKAHGRYIFVRLTTGEIICSRPYSSGNSISNRRIYHSCLANGKKVTSAGEFFIEKGRLVKISNNSGHYKPTNEQMLSDLSYYYRIAKVKDLIYQDHSTPVQLKPEYPVMTLLYMTHLSLIQPISHKQTSSNFFVRCNKNLKETDSSQDSINEKSTDFEILSNDNVHRESFDYDQSIL